MPSSIKVKDNTKAIMEALRALTRDRVLVGIPADKAAREPDSEDPNPEISNSTIGFINEFGEPSLNIPARPHLVPGVKKALPKVEQIYAKAARAVLTGDTAAAQQAHNKVGLLAAGSVVEVIMERLTPALAERTLSDRKSKGITGDLPLVATGQYRRSITYAIRPASEVKSRD